MNQLKHLPQFRQLLADYRTSPSAKDLLKKVNLVLLAAPTSSGRNTIIKQLLKTGQYHYIVSDTTREPRINDGVLEKDGVEYWFRGEEAVLSDIKAGLFLEAAVIHNQQVSGISLRELQTAQRQKKIAVTDIEMVGVDNIVLAKPDVMVVFVLPPDFEEWQQRLNKRGKMPKAEYIRRLQSALKEFRHALSQPYYHFVVNDQLHTAVATIENLTKNFQQPAPRDGDARQKVEALCLRTQQHLASLLLQP